MPTPSPKDLSDAHTHQPSLAGRRIAITGGTTGIGRAIAIQLASEGARVFVCGRDETHLADALESIRHVGEGDGMAIDLAGQAGPERFFETAEDRLGGLDGAVINAAIPAQTVADTPEADLEYQIATDFTAYLLCTRQAALRLSAGSDIVLIGSMSAISQEPGSSIYVAAKAGIEGLARGLRKELAERDIKVGLVEPGFTGADFQYPDFPPEKQRELIHADKMLRAEDIAVSVHFMLTQPRRAAVSLIRTETRLEHS